MVYILLLHVGMYTTVVDGLQVERFCDYMKDRLSRVGGTMNKQEIITCISKIKGIQQNQQLPGHQKSYRVCLEQKHQILNTQLITHCYNTKL